MSISVLNILCEGYSEQRFALTVLKKYLLPHNIIVRTSLLVTNKKTTGERWRTECKDNAELVNTSRETSPSKRIIRALEGKYNYNKPQMAEIVTEDMGIDGLRRVCPHFNQWIGKLLRVAPNVQ